MQKFLVTFQATTEVEVEIDETKSRDSFTAAIRAARQQLDPDIDWDVETARKIPNEEEPLG